VVERQRAVKVLHLSALDSQTGAGIAAARIHEGLRARNVDSRFCVAYSLVGLDSAFTPKITLLGRADRLARRKIDGWLVRLYSPDYDNVLSTGIGGLDIRRIVARVQPDILQLHWIGGNSFSLGSLSGVKVPVVWRLPDMWPFCGLEHYESNPQKYVDSPKFGIRLSRPYFDISEFFRYRKLATYRTIRDMRIVCPSRWLMSEVKRSALLGSRDVSRIPTSCDTASFLPKDRRASRKALGIPVDKFVVLVGATSMRTRWKGLDLFVNAMAQVGRDPSVKSAVGIHVVSFGKDPFQAPELNGLLSIEHFGQVKDRRLMSILYNAADVFVAPSRMENLSNAVLEALSCGTPVVAFNVGGMPDMIEHKSNGFLASPFDTSNLADGIRWAIDRRDDEKIRDAARNKILKEFSLENEINQYIDLYGKLLASTN
jgi:glycosyltransferase involved in cell wall biosynthesis